MNQVEKKNAFISSALSDRGLNERRPLNEDAYLADSQRGIFAVADGVGGAEAGEVASQTAIEVLDEAFRHQVNGADIEDLMELAIQRANASIHQMSQDHKRFSMMATTIVALHLKENIATIGHVGDSRLYRLTPDGSFFLETEDHSVVEEEVRAGRMTREQAANHPSKNVISRALGAEDSVEVDMKTIEIEDGTEFLLCTDGITRHVSDPEIRQLLVIEGDLNAVCEELKRRCYDRGAEDNLTAVVVRYGERIGADRRSDDMERTISPDYEYVPSFADTFVAKPATTQGDGPPPSSPEFSAAEPSFSTPLDVAPPPPKSSGLTRMILRLLALIVFVTAVAGAFFAGARFKEQVPFFSQGNNNIPEVESAPAPVASEDPFLQFEKARREVDRDSNNWLANELGAALSRQGITNPLESIDPEFLYLYGRASLLAGKSEEAGRAFEAAITTTDLKPGSHNSVVRKEATLGLAAVSLKTGRDRWRALTHLEELTQMPSNTNSP